MTGIPLADIIDWGWFRIGPPYIYLNIDPVMFNLGPLPVRWYGLMYVVAIIMGLWAVRGYRKRKGLTNEILDSVLWWCIVAGLVGGRLYFVIQQRDLVQGYLMQPWRIFAFWEGGMAFYGAIFLVMPTLIWRARRVKVNPMVLLDASVYFAAAGQIFGRIGNLINGDITGYIDPSLPWATVYNNSHSWIGPIKYGQPVVPAAAYELLTNVVLLAVIFLLARKVKRPGILTFTYLFAYAITQFVIFFVRDNEIFPFFGIALRQAQWTSIVVFILLIPLCAWVMRTRLTRPIPEGAVAATYGLIEQDSSEKNSTDSVETEDPILDEQIIAETPPLDIKVEEDLDHTRTETNITPQ